MTEEQVPYGISRQQLQQKKLDILQRIEELENKVSRIEARLDTWDLEDE